MQTRELVLQHPHGLHMRMARAVVRLGRQHRARMTLSCGDCRYADGCSMLALLMLEAGPGARIQVQVEGPDENQVVEKLAELFSEGGGI